MHPIDYKLECLKLAVQTAGYSLDDGITKVASSSEVEKIIKDAQAYFDFITV